jgi:hypothetical protein
MPKRAYSYLRCSRRKQRKGDSIRRQSVHGDGEELDRGGMAALAAEICAEEGAVLDDALVFEDIGVSARRGRNAAVGALAKFLHLVERGRIAKGSLFIFENIDRLSRDKLPRAMKLFLGLLEAGIVIWTARPRRRYTLQSVSDLPGILEPLIHMVRAYEESERKSVLLREMWAKKKRLARDRKPVGRQAPAWLELTPDGYRPREPHWATVKAMVRMAVERGWGAKRIMIALSADPRRYPPMGRSGRWSLDYVLWVLHSRTLVGEYQPGGRDDQGGKVLDGKPVPGYYPAVLTDREWWELQAAIEGRRRKVGRPGAGETSLFTGLLFEARSKKRLRVRPGAGARGRCLYLQPERDDRRANPWAGAEDRFPYQPLEEGILRMLDELRADDLRPDQAAQEREARVVQLTGDLVALEHREKVLKGQVADPAQDPAVLDTLLDVLRSVAARKGETARELERLKLEGQSGREEVLGELQSLVAMMRAAKGDERAALRGRVKAALPFLVKEIWALAQVETRRRKVIHIQIRLRCGGEPLYGYVIPCDAQWGTIPQGLKPWDLDGVDLRTWREGDIGGVAGDAPIPA